MKGKPLIAAIVFAFFSTGCVPLLKSWYGIREPEFESHESILRFQDELGYEQIPYLGLRFSAWEHNKLFRSPDVFVFDRAGRYIPYRDSLKLNCNGPAGDFIAELNPERNYVVSGQYTLDSFLEILEAPECGTVTGVRHPETDFYVFITIAKFGGKRIVREKTDAWIRSLQSNRTIRYRLYFVNQDPKSCWTTQQKQKLEGN